MMWRGLSAGMALRKNARRNAGIAAWKGCATRKGWAKGLVV
jgi:hypothetical protein